MTEIKWTDSQSNHDVWTVILLNKQSCALIINYSF